MPALRHALWLCLCLAVLAPLPLRAQGGAQAPLTIAVTGDDLQVDVACAGATPTIAIDGAPARPSALQPLAPEAVRLVLVLDSSGALDGPGTPYSTHRADLGLLATVLLDRLPPGSLVSLLHFDSRARLALPLGDDMGAVHQALGALAATPASPRPPTTPAALADAIRLGAAQLEGSGGHQGLALIAVDPRAPDSLARQLRATLGEGPQPGVFLLGEGEAGAATGSELRFHTADSAALPSLMAAYGEQVERMLGLRRVRLTLPVGELEPGTHELTMAGCGEPLAATFSVPAAGPRVATQGLAALSLLCGAVGFGVWRRRRGAIGSGSPPAGAGEGRAALEVTTARRITVAEAAPQLSVVVWDGHERRSFPLVGRHCTLGRDAGCDLRIASEWVSGLHARISVVGEGLTITDLESTSGTFLGDHGRCLPAGTPAPLALGEVVLIGPEVRLTVHRAEPASTEDES